MVPNEKKGDPYYKGLLDACREHGISKTVAYELANAGLLDTFKIGERRYVVMESLRALPEKMKESGGKHK